MPTARAIVAPMKLVRQTPEKLVLLHRPLGLSVGLAVCALVILLMGLWHLSDGRWMKAGIALLVASGLMMPAIWFFTERVEVVLDAFSRTATIDMRRLTGPVKEQFRLDQVQEALVQTRKGPGYATAVHRVALLHAPGEKEDQRPLTNGYTNGRSATDTVARINSWLHDIRQNSGS